MNALRNDLAALLGSENVTTGAPDRSAYAHDLWPRQLLALRGGVARPEGPGAVVWPTRDEHLSQLIALARRTGMRLVPFGAGSGVVGALQLEHGTIAVDLKRMRTLHSVDVEAGTATADAGILGQHLEDSLGVQGATLGHFPSSIYCSTLGGWVVTRSAGQCSGRYGKIEDMVLSAQGVLADGEPFRAGAPTGGGIDTRPLLVGSEGLFGFVTQATVRVWPKPTEKLGRAFTFATVREGYEAMRALYQAGLRPAVARLYDPFDSYVFRTGKRHEKREPRPFATGPAARLREALSRRVLAHPRWLNVVSDRLGEHVWGRTLLLLMWEQCPGEDARPELERAVKLLCERGGIDEGSSAVERWQKRRHSVSFRMPPTFEQGVWVDTMEVAARWSCFDALYHGVREALGSGGFVMAHLSHAYPDGCSIYFTFAGADTDDRRALERYLATWRSALAAAHRAGGTISHHHGVGRSKRQAMGLEVGAGVAMIERLTDAADPHGVMLRGALVPTRDEALQASEPEFGTGLRLDVISGLCAVPAETTLDELHPWLAERGFVLREMPSHGALAPALRVRLGAAVERDPVDHAVAGWVARLGDGRRAWWLAAPRRAAGPDLLPLWLDPAQRFGALEQVTLRVHRADEPRAAFAAPCVPPAAGPPDRALAAWLERLAR